MADEDAASSSTSAPRTTPRTTQTQSNITQELVNSIIKPQSQAFTVQLEESNYLLWKFQIKTTIRGYGIEDYVLGTISVPPKFTADQDGKLISNKDYTTHQKQDSLISSWLISSISANLLP